MVVAATLLAVLAWGCDEGRIIIDPPPPLPKYLPQTSPENVVNNLMASYERREIDRYAALLDPTFIFKFQQADIPPDLPRDYWNRDEDSTGTGALFGATEEVSQIMLDLGAYASEDAGRIDEPGTKRIRLTHAKLEVDQYTEAVLLVQGDIQDMYFRRGSAAAGTDSTKWYLFEWHDLSGGDSRKPATATSGPAVDMKARALAGAHVQPTTWGRIKQTFH
jgi:hypothetical protein